ncbi:MAG: universal stress protein [Alphaproteobacteria bacterium]|nr:universal stress protein [Alphaproteobacteria bacterium]
MSSPVLARKFLLVVDRSAELRAAMRFACRRAMRTDGEVLLFHAVPKSVFHHFASVGDLMEREARNDAEKLLQSIAADVYRMSGRYPAFHIREGDTLEQLRAVATADPSISVLVLGAGAGPEGPGPIISALSGALAGKIKVPITIVPGNLSDEQIDALT